MAKKPAEKPKAEAKAPAPKADAPKAARFEAPRKAEEAPAPAPVVPAPARKKTAEEIVNDRVEGVLSAYGPDARKLFEADKEMMTRIRKSQTPIVAETEEAALEAARLLDEMKRAEDAWKQANAVKGSPGSPEFAEHMRLRKAKKAAKAAFNAHRAKFPNAADVARRAFYAGQ